MNDTERLNFLEALINDADRVGEYLSIGSYVCNGKLSFSACGHDNREGVRVLNELAYRFRSSNIRDLLDNLANKPIKDSGWEVED